MSPAAVSWSPPANRPSCGDHEVHVWRAALGGSRARLARLMPTLSEDERVRAERFRSLQDRQRYVIGRGLLRTILGCYLDVPPAALRFRYTEYGKPSLSGGADADALRFNVSHSDELALYAVSRDRDIGVDIERVRPHSDTLLRVVARFLDPRDVAMIVRLPLERQQEAVLSAWTRIEAALKVRGVGLSKLATSAMASAGLTIETLAPGRGYVAALAVDGDRFRLTCWDWPEEL